MVLQVIPCFVTMLARRQLASELSDSGEYLPYYELLNATTLSYDYWHINLFDGRSAKG